MPGRVLVLGRVATANVPAAQAQAKVHPSVAHLQAFFTPASVRLYLTHLIEMSAVCQCLPTFLSYFAERLGNPLDYAAASLLLVSPVNTAVPLCRLSYFGLTTTAFHLLLRERRQQRLNNYIEYRNEEKIEDG